MATLVSNLGGLIQAVGAGWMMTTLTPSSHMVALVQASTTLPLMALSLPAGVLADNFDRRKIMLTAQSLMLIFSALLAASAFAGILSPWLLLSFTFLIGCGGALNNPSWQASVGDIVPREDLPAAVALNSMGFNLMRSVGPGLGGVVVATLGAAVAFAINSVSYLALIFVLIRWRRATAPRDLPREAFGPAISAGIRYVAMSPNLLKVMLRGFLFGSSAVSILALLPLAARDFLQGNATTYGILLGCFGIGAVFGALLNARMHEKFRNETIIRITFTGYALAAFVLASSHDRVLSGVALMLAGACWVGTLSLLNVAVQLSTPRWVVGRSVSLHQTSVFGGMAGGSWLWGLVTETLGLQTALMSASVMLVLGALVGLRLALPDYATLNLDPLDRFREPPLRLDVSHRTGPIMVMVDYEIAEEDVPDFLSVMTDRRRIRLRDGARRWALLRDLENPDIWTESYHVATWVEYVRHNQRRTQSDLAVRERLHALHRGGSPPRVRRMIERQTVPKQAEPTLKPHTEPH